MIKLIHSKNSSHSTVHSTISRTATSLDSSKMSTQLSFLIPAQEAGFTRDYGRLLGENIVISTFGLDITLPVISVKQLDLEFKRGFFYEANLFIEGVYFMFTI